MDDDKLVQDLIDIIDEISCDEDLTQFSGGAVKVTTFREAGLLTANKGLVLRFEDGSEFQVGIIQSKEAR